MWLESGRNNSSKNIGRSWVEEVLYILTVRDREPSRLILNMECMRRSMYEYMKETVFAYHLAWMKGS